MKELFTKILKKTDINTRLAVPTQCLKDLPSLSGSHYTYLRVNDESSKKAWMFRLSRRKKGHHAKPVLTKGWIEFVKRKELEIGDKITLINEDGRSAGASYTVQAMKKKLRLLGQDFWVLV